MSNNKKTDRFGLERFGFTDKEAGGGSAALKEAGGGSAALKDCSNVRETATQGSGISKLQIRNFIYGSRFVCISRGWPGLGLIQRLLQLSSSSSATWVKIRFGSMLLVMEDVGFFLTLVKGEEKQSRKKYITRPIMYKYLKRRPLHAL